MHQQIYNMIPHLKQAHVHIFDALNNGILLLYFVILIGALRSAPQYLNILQFYFKLYIGVFLTWRFNPFRMTKFNAFDAKVAFNAGIVFLLALDLLY